ncbi:hypothetical protein F5141DRAFT_1218265 [Pisolithus sp. B1]|nr:hypothetical protein F5141DRAFT_1218265 [Pisolithus sp. B1]
MKFAVFLLFASALSLASAERILDSARTSAARSSPLFLDHLLGSATQGLLAPATRSPRAVPRRVAGGIVREYLTSQVATIDGVG